jgi:rhodanese-related sulfurtransferase
MQAALAWGRRICRTGWLFRRQLEDVVAALSRFGAAIGYALVAGVLAYLIFKCVRLWRNHRAYRAHRMTPAELKQRMEAGDPLVVVDLRADAERQEGCIPGALAVAFRDLDALLLIVGAREVVFYCSCPNELASIRAALRLKRHGITRLHALEGGFSGWRALGFPWTPACPAWRRLSRRPVDWRHAEMPTAAARQLARRTPDQPMFLKG